VLLRRPDVSPVFVTLFNLLLLGGGGYWMIGQKRKALVAMATTFVSTCCCVGLLVPVMTALDVWHLSQRLASGESVGEDECAVPAVRDALELQSPPR